MIQLRNRFRFPIKAVEIGRLFDESPGQHLDGSSLPHQLVFCEIDTAHPAAADMVENLVFGEKKPLDLAGSQLLTLPASEQFRIPQKPQHPVCVFGKTPPVRTAALGNRLFQFFRTNQLAASHQVDDGRSIEMSHECHASIPTTTRILTTTRGRTINRGHKQRPQCTARPSIAPRGTTNIPPPLRVAKDPGSLGEGAIRKLPPRRHN